MPKKCGDKKTKSHKRFTCAKCGAAANDKGKLCKPSK